MAKLAWSLAELNFIKPHKPYKPYKQDTAYQVWVYEYLYRYRHQYAE